MNKLIKKYNYLKEKNEKNKKYTCTDRKAAKRNKNKVKLPGKKNFNPRKKQEF